jgi:ElaB/YqjD/DUF883 family membrane-anchored ribosome-binding protein
MISELASCEIVVRKALCVELDMLFECTRDVILRSRIARDLPLPPQDYIQQMGTGGEREENLTDRTAVINALLEELIIRCALTYTQVNLNKDHLTEIDTKLETLTSNINDLKAGLEGINNLLNNLNDKIQEFDNLVSLISSKIDDLSQNINEMRDQIINEIDTQSSALKSLIDRLSDFVTHSFSSLRNKIETEIERSRLRIFAKIDLVYEDVLTLSHQIEDNIIQRTSNYIQSFFNDGSLYWNLMDNLFENKLNTFRQFMNDEVKGMNPEATLTYVDNRIGLVLNAFETVELEIASVATETAKVGASVDAVTLVVGVIENTVLAIEGNIVLIFKDIKLIKTRQRLLLRIFGQFKPSFYQWLEKMFDSITDDVKRAIGQYIDEHHDQIVNLITEGTEKTIPLIGNDVTNKIVGESYSRWNSIISFYPTIVFIMKEDKEGMAGRRAQVKLRYYKKSEDITEEDIHLLKQKAQDLAGFSYHYGDLRVNFVSKNKQTKTTLYVFDRSDASRVLNAFCDLVNQIWDEDDLTYTQGSRRLPITRRTSVLDNINPFIVNYNEVFKMKLFKITLLINGLEKPLLLFQDD